MLKIQRDVERAVQTLSYQNHAQIEIEGPERFSFTLTRSRFADLTMVCPFNSHELKLMHFV